MNNYELVKIFVKLASIDLDSLVENFKSNIDNFSASLEKSLVFIQNSKKCFENFIVEYKLYDEYLEKYIKNIENFGVTHIDVINSFPNQYENKLEINGLKKHFIDFIREFSNCFVNYQLMTGKKFFTNISIPNSFYMTDEVFSNINSLLKLIYKIVKNKAVNAPQNLINQDIDKLNESYLYHKRTFDTINDFFSLVLTLRSKLSSMLYLDIPNKNDFYDFELLQYCLNITELMIDIFDLLNKNSTDLKQYLIELNEKSSNESPESIA